MPQHKQKDNPFVSGTRKNYIIETSKFIRPTHLSSNAIKLNDIRANIAPETPEINERESVKDRHKNYLESSRSDRERRNAAKRLERQRARDASRGKGDVRVFEGGWGSFTF